MMRRSLQLTLFFILTLTTIQSGMAQGYNTINANNIYTGMHSIGTMFWDLDDSTFFVPYNGSNSPTAIFAGGLWMSGLTSEGELKLVAQEYTREFIAGPINADFIDFDFDKVWKVTASEINELMNDFSNDGIVDTRPPENLLNWPGVGNQMYTDQLYSGQFFAPFHDQNNDNNYNPYEGDYPVVNLNGCEIIPDELLYSLYHTHREDQPIMEVHSILYAYNSAEDSIINNSLFLQQKILNLEEELLDCNIAFWVDFDIGCHDNDYAGCEPSRNTNIAYNATEKDDERLSCDENTLFYDDTPIVSYTFLNKPLSLSLIHI